ncbi:hypothetical protein COCON_G00012840, partial [Conger conger]
MVVRFIEQQQAICAVLAGDRNTWHLMPKDSEITVLEEVSQLLGSLHEFTDILASEKQVTLSALTPDLEHISNEILQEQPTDSNLTKQMKEIMRKDMLMQLRYTEEMKNVLNISSFMDPRFKGNFIENLDQTVKGCIEEAMLLASHLILDALSTEATQSPSSSSSTTTTTTNIKEKSLCGLLKKITAAKMNRVTASVQEKVDDEVKLYLSLPTVSADSDPLEWWKAHVEEMPMLSKVARSYLCSR